MVSGIQSEFECRNEGSIMQTIEFLETQDDIKIMSNTWPWFGYYNDFNATSLYSEDIDFLVHKHTPDIVSYNTAEGAPYNKTLLDERFELIETFSGSCGDISYVYLAR